VRRRGNRYGFRRFFENEVKRAFNLTVKEATRLFGDTASESIRAEMEQMVKKKVWMPINWNEVDTMVIPSKMFLKEKKDSNCCDQDKIETRGGRSPTKQRRIL
jgi:hypothetical protein